CSFETAVLRRGLPHARTKGRAWSRSLPPPDRLTDRRLAAHRARQTAEPPGIAAGGALGTRLWRASCLPSIIPGRRRSTPNLFGPTPAGALVRQRGAYSRTGIDGTLLVARSEERRVGKEGASRGAPAHWRHDTLE